MIKVCIFDLDGTLADTVESMAYSANLALQDLGLRAIESQRFCYFAGDGADNLIHRTLEEAGDPEGKLFPEMKELYMKYFSENCMYQVHPYEGIPEVLEELKKREIKIAVLSNKPHQQTLDVIRDLFGNQLFHKIQGQEGSLRKKPAPDGALKIAEELKAEKEECLYIGDTNTDMQTGNAAGMYTIGVLWGFRTREELEENHAAKIIGHPKEILQIIEDGKREKP